METMPTIEPLHEPGWCGVAVVSEINKRIGISEIDQTQIASALGTDDHGTRPESIASYYQQKGIDAEWKQPPTDTPQAAEEFLVQLDELRKSQTQVILDMVVFYPGEETLKNDPVFRQEQGHYVIFEELANNESGKFVVINDPSTVEGFRGKRQIEVSEFIKDWEDWHPDNLSHLTHRALIISPA